MTEDFMKLLFETRDQTHYLHLVTTSKAEHVALGDFYDQLLEMGDGLMEKMIAFEGSKPSVEAIIQLRPKGNGEAVIRSFIKELKKFRGKSPAIDADLDNLEAMSLQTIYLLGLK